MGNQVQKPGNTCEYQGGQSWLLSNGPNSPKAKSSIPPEGTKVVNARGHAIGEGDWVTTPSGHTGRVKGISSHQWEDSQECTTKVSVMNSSEQESVNIDFVRPASSGEIRRTKIVDTIDRAGRSVGDTFEQVFSNPIAKYTPAGLLYRGVARFFKD
jgi:hypothetical protein